MEFKGWAFIELGPRGELRRTGVVVDRVSEGLYLCHFKKGKLSDSQVVLANQMLSWKLFPDEQELQGWMKSMQEAQQIQKGSPDPEPNATSDDLETRRTTRRG